MLEGQIFKNNNNNKKKAWTWLLTSPADNNRQAGNRQAAHSTDRNKHTGFTMGISRGSLHWDNKNVALSIHGNQYKLHLSYTICNYKKMCGLSVLIFTTRKRKKCATCSLFQSLSQRICRCCFRHFLDEIYVKQKASKYFKCVLHHLFVISDLCLVIGVDI